MKDAIPQMTWEEAVSELFHSRFETLYTVWNEGTTDQELYLVPTEEVDESEVQELAEHIDELLSDKT